MIGKPETVGGNSGMDNERKRPAPSGETVDKPPVKKRVTADLESVKLQLENVKKLRGRGDLSRGEMMDILYLYFRTCKLWHEEKATTGKVPGKMNAAESTASALGRSTRSVSRVVKQYTDSLIAGVSIDPVVAASGRGNFKSKESRISHSKSVYYKVRDFISSNRRVYGRTTGSQVLEFLRSSNLIRPIKETNGIPDTKDYAAALKATQAYLRRKGFCSGKRSGSLCVSFAQMNKRDKYIWELVENRKKGSEGLREVYLDESHLHHHAHVSSQERGRRQCFVAAIQGASPKDPTQGPCLVPDSIWSFTPKPMMHNPRSDPHSGDLCKNFNAETFSRWWKNQLLPNLKEPSLIIMDEAAYHRAKPPHTPSPADLSKDELLDTLLSMDIVEDPNKFPSILRQTLAEELDKRVKPYVVQLAEAAGHRVIFTPACYSDLQPMEHIWDFVKSTVRAQYTEGSEFPDVLERLNAQLKFLQTEEAAEKFQAAIAATNALVSGFQDELMRDENPLHMSNPLSSDDDAENDDDVDDDDLDNQPGSSI
mmetsp:Transcript_17828/g.32894  ORF Transcript_17828/g.32894 Transcript_17828/m.32894 type:complete len:538 (+) Transcript_17828:255-1868(+)|eukprot:CAMPEP_0184525670 /NCGR_PEP_ID=MMETSP0198_2-20121128/10234_1 /TAXON_ID=1112570 /ORGANISM="Thraustochytrium sp., Strain LLF1b" /LENGTH=537 /DNA_ID=CAMNT_0026917169 /DNA_START=135 /DNA_END=1748 /DNA_ORIENTATION=-